MFNMINTDSWS